MTLCPFYPIHIAILYLCLLLPLLLALVEATDWNLSLTRQVLGQTRPVEGVRLREDTHTVINVTCNNCRKDEGMYTLVVDNGQPQVSN